MYIDRIVEQFTGRGTTFGRKVRSTRYARTFTEGNIYRIRDVKLPVMDPADEDTFFNSIFGDTFTSYVLFDDDYSEKTFDFCDGLFGEGLYCLMNDKVNVTVKPGDIVIDAGSWCGDFAAYASVKGAKVYAFEPTDTTFEFLKKTAELNENIIPIKKGLSDEAKSMTLFEYPEYNTGSNSLWDKGAASTKAVSTVETVRLDDFVREHNLPRVDFIKSDIEGFERRMLAGAQETLARFAPKLALCTYHLPDDPQVMAELILKANPKYNIVQKRMKLFASVPE